MEQLQMSVTNLDEIAQDSYLLLKNVEMINQNPFCCLGRAHEEMYLEIDSLDKSALTGTTS